MGYFFRFFLFLGLLFYSNHLFASPVLNLGPTSIQDASPSIQSYELSSGYRVDIVGHRIFLYNLYGERVAQGYLDVFVQQLQATDSFSLDDIQDAMIETLAFLDAEVLEIGQLVEMINSLLSDLAAPDWNMGGQQGLDFYFVGSFNLSSGTEIWVYNITGPQGFSGIYRVNTQTWEGRFTGAEGGLLQLPDGSTEERGEDSGSEGGTTGQGDGDEDDDIFIPPTEPGNQGSPGDWADSGPNTSLAWGEFTSFQEAMRNGDLQFNNDIQTDWH